MYAFCGNDPIDFADPGGLGPNGLDKFLDNFGVGPQSFEHPTPGTVAAQMEIQREEGVQREAYVEQHELSAAANGVDDPEDVLADSAELQAEQAIEAAEAAEASIMLASMPDQVEAETQAAVLCPEKLTRNPLWSDINPEAYENFRPNRLVMVDGKWRQLTRRGNIWRVNGNYNFVLRNDQLYIGRTLGHAELGLGLGVEWAGEIRFDNKGQLEWWDNNSGHYQFQTPEAWQSGLPMDKYRPFTP